VFYGDKIGFFIDVNMTKYINGCMVNRYVIKKRVTDIPADKVC